ncbi:MAG: hypothetical protein Q8R92_09140 [Deltaproteobacteria bacterium]|nr:hypothetical protein [Deltaproteobacteria bacterium]
MPCLSGKFDPAVGPIVNIAVLAPGSWTPSGITVPSVVLFPALIDTGATTTCISGAVASTVGLSPIGMRPMTSATHSVPVNVYLADLVVPFGTLGFGLPGQQVMEFVTSAAGPYQVLLGRDIICRGSLSISFDGHFTFSL